MSTFALGCSLLGISFSLICVSLSDLARRNKLIRSTKIALGISLITLLSGIVLVAIGINNIT